MCFLFCECHSLYLLDECCKRIQSGKVHLICVNAQFCVVSFGQHSLLSFDHSKVSNDRRILIKKDTWIEYSADMSLEQAFRGVVTPTKRPRGRPPKLRSSHDRTLHRPPRKQSIPPKRPRGRPPKARLPQESPTSTRLQGRTQPLSKPIPGTKRNTLEPRLSQAAKSQQGMSEALMNSQVPPAYFYKEYPDGFRSCLQLWAQQQSSYVLANYPRSGYPPILQVDIPLLAHPRLAACPQSAISSSNVPPGARLPYNFTGYRTAREKIQLTVAIHLYMETFPGPLLDDYTIAQIVFHRLYGIPWSAPVTALLSNLNANTSEVSTKLRPLYEEVINDRDTWTVKACDAYAIWASFCRGHGVEPPPAWVGRWW